MANRILTKGRYQVPAGQTWALQSGKGTVDLISSGIGTLGRLNLGEVDLSFNKSFLGPIPNGTTGNDLIDAINARTGFIGLPIPENIFIDVLGSSVVFIEDAPVTDLDRTYQIINGAGVAAERTIRVRNTGTGTYDNLAILHGDGQAIIRIYSDAAATNEVSASLVDLNALAYPMELDNDTVAIGSLDIEISGGSFVVIQGVEN